MINSAFIFGVDELKVGEELAKQALNISQSYPHPFWMLAVNLYYQGRLEEALQYAKLGYDLDPTIEESKKIYETIEKHSEFKKTTKQSFFYITI